MISRSVLRAILTSAAIAAGGALLAGCNTDDISLATNAKANQPVPPKLIQAMVEKDMDLNSPMLVRIFKTEAELEVWKQNRSGQFALLKTYPICRWSGDLGPKVKEGDRQAPEGFYSITPAQMNPASQFYLSFNTGYPNAFDQALGRTGSQLMVHGDCSSRGCYAMTDEQIAEIYSLGRKSFFGGQRSFQLQAYPFKMTPINMAKHRNNPNMPFWKMIKEGYDHFEVTKQEPKVEFCDKRYVFDPIRAPNATRDPVFNASAKCPAYAIPEDIADAVREKQQREAAETAKLISRGTPMAKMNQGIDGGMHKVFAAKVQDGSTGLSEGGDGQGLSLLAVSRAPGTIPSHVNPPKMPRLTPEEEPLSRCPLDRQRACAAASPARAASRKDGSPASPARSASAAPRPPQAPRPRPSRRVEAKRSEPAPPRVTAAVPKSETKRRAEADRRRTEAGAKALGHRDPPPQPRPLRSRARRRSCLRTRSKAASAR